MASVMRTAVLLMAATAALAAAERETDSTFLYRYVPGVAERPAAGTTATCRYRPVFGAGDAQARLLRGIARYGELHVDSGGACETVNYPGEEQVYVVLDGSPQVNYGAEKSPVRKNDFMYVAPGIPHAFANSGGTPARIVVMGFRVPPALRGAPPARLPIANIDDVKKEVVGGHPPSTLYQLLMGNTESRRDKLATARVLTSLFIMEFAPGGTNFPHHHENEEEIYLVLDGHGDMVAGGGVDGVENRRPARAGDAYFFRLNCTVGFYNSNVPGEPKAHILAVRSLFPRR